MNKIKNLMFITFFSLLILNMLIIFFGLYSYFFSLKDYTLIAGIIAFIGAVIGGSITLIGVNRTIHEGRRLEELKQLPFIIRLVNLERESITSFSLDIIEHNLFEKDEEELLKIIEKHMYDLEIRRSKSDFLSIGKQLSEMHDKIYRHTSHIFSYLKYNYRIHVDFDLDTTLQKLSDIITQYIELSDAYSKELKSNYFHLKK